MLHSLCEQVECAAIRSSVSALQTRRLTGCIQEVLKLQEDIRDMDERYARLQAGQADRGGSPQRAEGSSARGEL